MDIPFFKFQGTGNDFVIIDQFDKDYLISENKSLVRKICHRKFGVGGDGLILLLPHAEHAFEMVYFNSDGNEGSLCGNGSRCAVECMRFQKRIENECSFLASDGYHSARIDRPGYIEVLMRDVLRIQAGDDFTIMDTGSPHYVTFIDNIETLDVIEQGRAIRFSDPFKEEGINVNFVRLHDASIEVATYERGVEDETLSCGTGVTASALAYGLRNGDNREYVVPVKTRGGQLFVKFIRSGTTFRNIWLCGPAELVFTGVWSDHSEEN